jgi:adenylylsulfate reductase subunit A
MAKGHRSQIKRARNESNRETRPSAKLSYARISVQKACYVLDVIRGKDVQTALGILTYNPRYASSVIKKLLESAIANAENNNGMNADNLYVAACYADKGPTMKRIQPRAQGVGAKQVNSLGEVYETKYGLTTSERVYGTVMENLEGRGPCYLRTEGISPQQDESLRKAYLNMAPSQTLKWVEAGKNPSEQNVEIEGTEPYIVGGHTASGYWVNTERETTIHGLYAAGDVAGGCPQKYVTGAMVEGEIAAIDMVSKLDADTSDGSFDTSAFDEKKALDAKASEYDHFLTERSLMFTTEAIEEAMQKVMDNYAGGISTHYQFNGKQLALAKEKINHLIELTGDLYASDMHELMFIYELKERLTVCLSVIAHLGARKETRWHSFAENLDYPGKSDDWMKYVNSRYENGQLHMIYRELVGREARYEHND